MTGGKSVGVGVGVGVFVGRIGSGGGRTGLGVFVGRGVAVGTGVDVGGCVGGTAVGGGGCVGGGVDVADKHCKVKGCKVQNGTDVGRGVDVGAGGAGVCVAQNTWSQQECFAVSSPSPSSSWAEIICASVMIRAVTARMRAAARKARRRGVATMESAFSTCHRGGG